MLSQMWKPVAKVTSEIKKQIIENPRAATAMGVILNVTLAAAETISNGTTTAPTAAASDSNIRLYSALAVSAGLLLIAGGCLLKHAWNTRNQEDSCCRAMCDGLLDGEERRSFFRM